MAGAERIVQAAIEISGLEDYTGNFHELGGGEVNETLLLEGERQSHILRITKTAGLDNLIAEDRALVLLDLPNVPQVVFFDPKQLIDERFWIIETVVSGSTPQRLSVPQFENLGRLLAHVHEIPGPEIEPTDLWTSFLRHCQIFGTGDHLLAHPHPQLRSFIHVLQQRSQGVQPVFESVSPRLVHCDVTTSNVLVQGDEVGLIDWEFATFIDPMREFAAMYYDDLETNRGKWKVQISSDEKQALFAGYRTGGGELAEDRIEYWMQFDKLTSAIFLHWKLHESGRPVPEDERKQNQFDLDNLLKSLEQYTN